MFPVASQAIQKCSLTSTCNILDKEGLFDRGRVNKQTKNRCILILITMQLNLKRANLVRNTRTFDTSTGEPSQNGS